MTLRRRGSGFEDRAARHLRERGWTVLARNYRDGPREIDLVVRRGEVIAFVEVKGRRSARGGHPFEAIGHRKRLDIERAARRWIRENPPGSALYRFDAVAITREGGRWRVEHLADAWRRTP